MSSEAQVILSSTRQFFWRFVLPIYSHVWIPPYYLKGHWSQWKSFHWYHWMLTGSLKYNRVLDAAIVVHYKVYRNLKKYRLSAEACWGISISQTSDWNKYINTFFYVLHSFIDVAEIILGSFWNEIKKHMLFYTFRWIFHLDTYILSNASVSEECTLSRTCMY